MMDSSRERPLSLKCCATVFSKIRIHTALKRLATKRLVETPYSHFRELAVPDTESPQNFYYRATSIGIYHIRFWIGSFSFLDAMSTDTPVFEESARADIAANASSFEIGHRFRKTACFRDYLESKWHLANFDAVYFDFPTVVASQKWTFDMVDRVVQKLTHTKTAGNLRIGTRGA